MVYVTGGQDGFTGEVEIKGENGWDFRGWGGGKRKEGGMEGMRCAGGLLCGLVVRVTKFFFLGHDTLPVIMTHPFWLS